MPEKTPTIGLIANPMKKRGKPLLVALVDLLKKYNVTPVMDPPTAKMLGDDCCEVLPIDELAKKTERILVLGGDGTLLWVFRQLGVAVKPLAAINTGSLGFLTCAAADESEILVEALVNGAYAISNRSIIQARLRIDGGEWQEYFALNEINLGRAANSRVVHIDARINDQAMNSYTGDGLIVATPTGSTAYSLSAGGPLVDPESGVFAFTPVCPHALGNRPIVVSDRGSIELRVPEQRDDLLMMVDGQLVAEFGSRAEVHICRAEFDLPLIQLPDSSFYNVLHQKLGWTGTALKPNGG